MLVVDYLNWIVQQIENNTKPNKIESLIKCLKQYPHTDYLIAIQMRLRLNAEQQHGSSINGSNDSMVVIIIIVVVAVIVLIVLLLLLVGVLINC